MTEPFAQLPKRLRGRSSVTVHVYFVLACYANGDRLAWPSLPTIAGEVRCRRSAVVAALRELVDLGLLKIEKADGKPNRYRLTRIPRERGTRLQADPAPGSQTAPDPGPGGSTNLEVMNENAPAPAGAPARSPEDDKAAFHWIDQLRQRGLLTDRAGVFQ